MNLKKEDNLAKDTREVMHKIHLGQMNTPKNAFLTQRQLSKKIAMRLPTV